MADFRRLAVLADAMAAEGSRLKKRAAIAEALVSTEAEDPGGEDVGRFALYLAGLPFAEADARKLNAGGALLGRAVKAVTGQDDVALRAAYRRHGDMGAATSDLLAQRTAQGPGLTLAEVAQAFAAMAAAKTTAIRGALVESLLRRAAPVEAKYLVKLMLGDMRIGVKQSLVEEAIAAAADAEVQAVRHAVMLEADLADVCRRAFDRTLSEARMRLFHPLGFMLASPVETPEEAVERFTAKPMKTPKPATRRRKPVREEPIAEAETEDEDAALAATSSPSSTVHGVEAFLEDKYDGMRAQLHCGDPEQPERVAIYSRNREDITESFPELVEAFARVSGTAAGAIILDGEILGWDYAHREEDGAIARALPFAVLGQRIGRKQVSDEWRRRVPVIFMAFDVMYANGELTLERPLRERRRLLETLAETVAEATVAPLKGPAPKKVTAQGTIFSAEPELPEHAPALPRLLLSPARLVEKAEEIDRAYADARARANEGVMLKAAGSTYQPGRRGLAWVKLKRELATLDVAITGAEYGHGRRAGILSDYTFAVRAQTGELRNVGKAYSGLTDPEIAALSEFLMQHTLEDYGHFRTVEPLVILEVAFNNVMRSERHASGFALRFPRILRLRTDKPLQEIDTLERVEEVYQSQVDKPAEL